MTFFSAELFILIKLTLSNFQTLRPCAFGINFKKSLPNARLQRFISMLSSKVFKTFILWFLIHSELVVYAMIGGGQTSSYNQRSPHRF